MEGYDNQGEVAFQLLNKKTILHESILYYYHCTQMFMLFVLSNSGVLGRKMYLEGFFLLFIGELEEHCFAD